MTKLQQTIRLTIQSAAEKGFLPVMSKSGKTYYNGKCPECGKTNSIVFRKADDSGVFLLVCYTCGKHTKRVVEKDVLPLEERLEANDNHARMQEEEVGGMPEY